MTTIADRGLLSWLQGWSQILNLIGDLVMLKYEICILTPSLLNGYDKWKALVLLHCHRHCKANRRWEMFRSVAPSLTSNFASYCEFGDVVVWNSQMDLLTTQRLWSMESPCLTPLPPTLQGQQTLMEAWVCGSRCDFQFCILLGYSVTFKCGIPKLNCSLLNGYDQWIALVLLHYHRHCKENKRWWRFGIVAPGVTSDFASYWEFVDVEVQNSQLELLTTQRLRSMDSPCLTPLSPPLQGQQTLMEVWLCGSRCELRFCILLGIQCRWRAEFPNWLSHHSIAMING